MSQKVYLTICAIVFFIISLMHLSRLLADWDFVLAGWTVPHWLSIPGFIVAGALSAWGFGLASRAGSRRTYKMQGR